MNLEKRRFINYQLCATTAALLSISLLLNGCAVVPATVAVQAAVGVAQAVANRPSTPAVTPASEVSRPPLNPWEDPTNPLYQRTVYFDEEAVEIKPEFLPMLRAHASYLGEHAEQQVRLEGHHDAVAAANTACHLVSNALMQCAVGYWLKVYSQRK
ncbi:hypothetical protein [Chromatium okenii]|uniref:Uncharacterized protein n=1 Tax=Chromatium okenii TaxID=61644 RepID=A0A2S7XNH8_9GAMM|nr:hypothetical protein [Chromatium okenii]PQJ94972.1 hypothetical protein CXB77_17845 [Chromatium okenii]